MVKILSNYLKNLKKDLICILQRLTLNSNLTKQRQISTQGLETESSLIYEAYFSAESIGNTNISANIILKIEGSPESKTDDNSNVYRIVALISGVIVVSAFLQNSKNLTNATFFRPT